MSIILLNLLKVKHVFVYFVRKIMVLVFLTYP